MRLHRIISIAALAFPMMATAQHGTKPDDTGSTLGTNTGGGAALHAEAKAEAEPGDSLRARDDEMRESARESESLSDAELEARAQAGREVWDSMSVEERASVRAVMRETREESREEMKKRWERMSPEEREDIRASAQARMRAGGAVENQ